ncbi:hypothetical protein ETAA8_65290 [Anatilimnocola aggregata]|uniref:DUF2997 domain-containing protein n=1 Tax=Anatilimnocola aggregata TaxID=2528021 RepID=A0A517YM99_9BACT|nr:DUF2997 domain-containing protein [Anatilimnocola aggregata]QDU31345.1 hypothetical protein ETAA8_64990 [Anatilimnocola aggregata]QDU31372.1 hypothetical protein ETAA8_65290 [Anatilimnocola aggregata]
MNRIIEVTISPTGETRLETHGFAGGACRQGSQFLEQALGAMLLEKLTPEFYASQVNQDQVARQQGCSP